MKTLLRPALSLLVMLSIVTGIAYPLAVTLVAQSLFPTAAHGSLIMRDGKPSGSRLIGQHFSDPKFFWGRPSATAGWPNNGLASGGSNQGPSNPALVDAVKQRVDALRRADRDQKGLIPLDLVSASASGLDPDISPAAARYQAARVARRNGLAPATVLDLIYAHTRRRQLGLFGEPRVNVLELNLAIGTAVATQ